MHGMDATKLGYLELWKISLFGCGVELMDCFESRCCFVCLCLRSFLVIQEVAPMTPASAAFNPRHQCSPLALVHF
jgi:hypothetical protein